MSLNQESEFSPQTYQKFVVSFKGSIQNVCLYNLTVLNHSNHNCYSFYFRYNSLRAIHSSCRTKPIYPKKSVFPTKGICCFKPKFNRETEFQDFFQFFLCPMNETEFFLVGAKNGNEGIANISMFLDLMDLRSQYPIDLSYLPSIPKGLFLSGERNPSQPDLLPSTQDENDLVVSTNASKNLEVIVAGRTFNFLEKRQLGSGSCGEVFLYLLDGIDDESHRFAIKFIDFNAKDEEMRLQKVKNILVEATLLTKLDHPNVVKGYFYHKILRFGIETFCNFMEFCNSGTLFDFLSERKGKGVFLSEPEIIQIFVEILKGVQYTRTFCKLKERLELSVHRDLKPATIFFHTNTQGQRVIKIADFGLAKTFLAESNPAVSLESNKDYQAPEMSRGEFGNEKSDIWSLGVILYNLCFFEFPWLVSSTTYQTYKLQKQLLKGKALSFEGQRRSISDKMQELICGMLKFNEKERMSSEDVFKHEFFSEELRKDAEITNKNTQRRITLNKKAYVGSMIEKKSNAQKIDKRFREYLESVQKGRGRNLKRMEEEEKKNEGPNIVESQFSERVESKGKSIISGFASESIKLEFKKVENKLIFLDYLDDKLRDFIDHIPQVAIKNKGPLRLMIQKIKLAILHTVLYNIEILPEHGGIWLLKSELMAFLSENREIHQNFLISLNDSVEKFKVLQEEVFEEVLKAESSGSRVYLGERIDVNQFLELVNPQVKREFHPMFRLLMEPLIHSLKDFIQTRIKEVDIARWSEQEKGDYYSIVNLYRGLMLLGMVGPYCDKMKKEEIKNFGPEKLRKNENGELDKIIEKLGI